MKALVTSVVVGLGLAGIVLAESWPWYQDAGYHLGELCVSNQGAGVGFIVGPFGGTDYVATAVGNGIEMRQWTYAIARSRTVTNVAHSGT
jgi:hypothetical protein